jgi:hypothetical protein
MWIVWEQSDEVGDGRSIYYMTSSNYGASWSQKNNLALGYPSSDLNTDPAIVQAANGTIWVVWSGYIHPLPEADFSISASPSSLTIPQNSSSTSSIIVTSIEGFSDPVQLNCKSIIPFSPYITTSLQPNPVTPPPDGDTYSTLTINVGASTVARNYSILVTGYSASLNQTKSVTVSLQVTSMSGSSVQTSENTMHTVSPELETGLDWELYYRTSNDNGTSWSRDAIFVENPAADLGPALLQASNGTLWLVWSSKRTGNSTIFCKTSSDFGATWSSDRQLVFNSSNNDHPAIAQTNNGSICVVWQSDRFQDYEIMYKIYNGSAWSGDLRLTNNGNVDTEPAILRTTDGTVWIFWTSSGTSEDSTGDIYYVQSTNNGSTWSSSWVQFTTDDLEDLQPSATQSVDGRIWVTWESNRASQDSNFDLYYKASLVHNIAVTDVIASSSIVYQKEIVTIQVTVENQGDYSESFNVSCYANSVLVGFQPVSLTSRGSVNLAFPWNTSGFARGNYVIKAVASVVSGESYLTDNTRNDGTVQVKLLGDINNNGIVDVFDTFALGKAFGSTPGQPNWNEEADLNGDNVVNTSDLSGLVNSFGRTG